MAEDDKLDPKPTPEFLAELVRVVKWYGWTWDYIEACRFVEEVHRACRVPVPDLTPDEDL